MSTWRAAGPPLLWASWRGLPTKPSHSTCSGEGWGASPCLLGVQWCRCSCNPRRSSATGARLQRAPLGVHAPTHFLKCAVCTCTVLERFPVGHNRIAALPMPCAGGPRARAGPSASNRQKAPVQSASLVTRWQSRTMARLCFAWANCCGRCAGGLAWLQRQAALLKVAPDGQSPTLGMAARWYSPAVGTGCKPNALLTLLGWNACHSLTSSRRRGLEGTERQVPRLNHPPRPSPALRRTAAF